MGPNGPLAAPLDLGGRVLSNRFATQPMEGWDGTREGGPSEHTLRRWRRFGQSGAKIVWGGEAYAVQEDGRANPNQLYYNPDANPAAALDALRESVRNGHREIGENPDDLYLGLQLTHSGRFARPLGPRAPRIAVHQAILDARFDIQPGLPLVTDAELEGIAESYVKSASLAAELGFDFVDVKCCHGYLLNELLGARSRPGRYGGSFENRCRLPLLIVAEIQRACPGIEVALRLSVGDVFPFSTDPESGLGAPLGHEDQTPYVDGFGIDAHDPLCFDLREPLDFIGRLREEGLRLLNVTVGSPYTCPHLQRPAAFPPSDGYEPPEDPLVGVITQMKMARRVKQEFPDLVVVGSGYSYLQDYLPHVAEFELQRGRVDLIGLGRMALSYPELPRDVLAGRPLARRRVCRTISDCTTAARNDMISGCFPLDPYYQSMPEAMALALLKKQRKHRD